MIVVIWLVSIIFLSIIIGEIKYQYSKINYVNDFNFSIQDWEQNIDTEIKNLSIEYLNDNFVSSKKISMRGSWRLAQDKVMGMEYFSRLKQEEYSKKL